MKYACTTCVTNVVLPAVLGLGGPYDGIFYRPVGVKKEAKGMC